MRLDIFCSSVAGKVRRKNEDMLAAGRLLVRDGQARLWCSTRDAETFMLAVSDGMGGHGCGDTASIYTLGRLSSALYGRPSGAERLEQDIVDAIEGISARLNRMSDDAGLERPMGCTLSGLFWAGERILLVNIGDSRTYRFRDGMLRRLTRDQNLLERDMTPLPRGKALYSCVGGGIYPDISVTDMSGKIHDGDRIAICSDGLSDMLEEDLIESLLGEGSVSDAGRRLSDAALDAGGKDNISLIVADVLQSRPGEAGIIHNPRLL